jgi:hypothetical protein
MPIASVNATLLDGALGQVPNNIIGHVAAIIGPSSTGSLLAPALYARPRDVQADFGKGPLVSLASQILYRTGKPALVMRTETASVGSYGSVDVSGKVGLSVVTTVGTVEPYDEYEAYVKIVVGGTVGVAGITYQTSLDGGRTLSEVKALGTATVINIAEGNVRFSMTAATLVAGDVWWCRTVAPAENAAKFTDAQTALEETALPWDFVIPATCLSATLVGAFDTWLTSLWNDNQMHKAARCCAVGPTTAQTEAQWIAALTADFASTTSKRIAVTAGYCEALEATPGRYQLRRPAGWFTACRALEKRIKPWKNDIGQVDLGSLGADIKIRDANGNRKDGLHDESLDPGLDSLGFETLTSLKGLSGVYCTTPYVKAPIGSDYYLWQYVAVTNRAADAATRTLMQRCRKYIFVDKKTGYIKDTEARDLNTEVEASVRAAVGDSVSAHSFAVGQTDNLLAQNAVVTGDLRIVPLAYPAGFDITIGMVNPATGVGA